VKNEFATGIKKIFFVVIAGLSMATSFLYFVEVFSFGRGLINETWVSVLVNGIVGVIVLDAAAIAWLKIYLGASDNNSVRALAAFGMIIGVIGSAVSSFIYLLLSANNYTISPDMRLYTQIAMAAIIVIHFLLVFAGGYTSTSAKIDEKTSEMLAEATNEMLTLTEEYFRQAIPGLAQQNARKLTDKLRGQFSKLSVDTTEPAALPQPAQQYPHANGVQQQQPLHATTPPMPTDTRRDGATEERAAPFE
jgi:hypothetical protein